MASCSWYNSSNSCRARRAFVPTGGRSRPLATRASESARRHYSRCKVCGSVWLVGRGGFRRRPALVPRLGGDPALEAEHSAEGGTRTAARLRFIEPVPHRGVPAKLGPNQGQCEGIPHGSPSFRRPVAARGEPEKGYAMEAFSWSPCAQQGTFVSLDAAATAIPTAMTVARLRWLSILLSGVEHEPRLAQVVATMRT